MTKNRKIMALFGLSMALLIISAIMGFTGLPQNADGSLVISFNVSGDQVGLLGGTGTFFGVFGITAFLLVVNFILALEVYMREKFFSYVIASATLALNFFFFIFASTITNIN